MTLFHASQRPAFTPTTTPRQHCRAALAAGTLLALCAALATPTQASVATAAFNRVPSGDPFLAYSTYRTMQDAAGRFTLAIDDDASNHSTRQFVSCPSDPNYYCSATNGGTPPGSPNSLTSAFSTSFYAASSPTTTGNASASANLADGTLRTTNISNGIVSQAFARMSDRLTFHVAGATAGTLTQIGISFILDGVLDAQGAGPAQIGTTLTVSSPNAQPTGFANLFYQDTSTLFVSQNATGWDSYTFSGTDPSHTVFTGYLTLQGATDIRDLTQALNGETWAGGISNYGSTSHLSLILPSHVTFTSDSGVFLTANSGGGGGGDNQVPEPPTWVLLAGVFLGSRWVQRRRR